MLFLKYIFIFLFFIISSVFSQTLNKPLVQFKTSFGDFYIILFPEVAPETVNNFLKYVEDGFYDDTIFHRVVDNFLIQGGGITTQHIHKPTYAPIVNESKYSLSNRTGRVSMALPLNKINQATSQFFINLSDNTQLDYNHRTRRGFTVFGEVIDGLDIVYKIASIPTFTRDFDFYGTPVSFTDVPKKQVVIYSVKILKNEFYEKIK